VKHYVSMNLFVELYCIFAGAVTYRVVQVTPNEDGQPQLVAGLPSNQVSVILLLFLCLVK